MILDLAPDFQINLSGKPYNSEGFRLIALGDPGAGKSSLLALLAEEAHSNTLPFVIFDVKGDMAALRELGDDVMIVGRLNHPQDFRRAHFDLEAAAMAAPRYASYVLKDGFSIVFDLSGRKRNEVVVHFSALLEAIYELAQTARQPVLVMIDEVHNFAPQGRSTRAQADALATLDLVMSEGRGLGLLVALATQFPQEMSKAVLRPCNVRLFGKLYDRRTFDYLHDYIPPGFRSFQQFRQFRPGQFTVWTANLWAQVQLRRRSTRDLGETPIPTVSQAVRPSVATLQPSLPGLTFVVSEPAERDRR